MALAKKGLRKIVIDDQVFYWKIRKIVSHNEKHNEYYGIPVQHESEGQLLLIYTGFCRSIDLRSRIDEYYSKTHQIQNNESY
ncbi:hypothetical protein NZD88_05025 [Chryseobacterium antibioticum]|uniref:GIY-YIG domain-containing protein n=1 Tax=Chryseobacterium pyrolae TaxID=2987481 RepID=A0ABT2IE55_9FLAO|nr:hypothetical protein [Chryseobacterium pyrolae]MCT2406914.1 hypothetical protein [Chryseobacterium pyrolae]